MTMTAPPVPHLAQRCTIGNPRMRHRALIPEYRRIRGTTEALAAPLTPEDQQVQSMPEASPTKWHLGHTAWFFETFVLSKHVPDGRPFHPRFGYLFNSYYQTLGNPYARPSRGLLSRPSL